MIRSDRIVRVKILMGNCKITESVRANGDAPRFISYEVTLCFRHLDAKGPKRSLPLAYCLVAWKGILRANFDSDIRLLQS